ncbi:MAG TPA: HIT family protein [Caulobacteraceae bacterium]|nr:HIT family protein [Caulobacteraceae bacterium]
MSLDGAYDRDNVFAKILRGELPAFKVFEDEHALALMDLFPQARGHVLVVPKAPARTLLDVEPEALQALIVRVRRVARAVRTALEPDGISVMQFNGAAGGQTVFHLHFHVIPRFEGEALKGHGQSGMADKEELAELARRIGAAM